MAKPNKINGVVSFSQKFAIEKQNRPTVNFKKGHYKNSGLDHGLDYGLDITIQYLSSGIVLYTHTHARTMMITQSTDLESKL